MVPKVRQKFSAFELSHRREARGGPFTCTGVGATVIQAKDVFGFERVFRRHDWLFAKWFAPVPAPTIV